MQRAGWLRESNFSRSPSLFARMRTIIYVGVSCAENALRGTRYYSVSSRLISMQSCERAGCEGVRGGTPNENNSWNTASLWYRVRMFLNKRRAREKRAFSFIVADKWRIKCSKNVVSSWNNLSNASVVFSLAWVVTDTDLQELPDVARYLCIRTTRRDRIEAYEIFFSIKSTSRSKIR